MRFAPAILSIAATSFLAACNSEEDCTQELISKKTTELQAKVLELTAADPEKLAAVGPKMQEYLSNPAVAGTGDISGACKAIDEIMAELNG
jgi:hypothetical protein